MDRFQVPIEALPCVECSAVCEHNETNTKSWSLLSGGKLSCCRRSPEMFEWSLERADKLIETLIKFNRIDCSIEQSQMEDGNVINTIGQPFAGHSFSDRRRIASASIEHKKTCRYRCNYDGRDLYAEHLERKLAALLTYYYVHTGDACQLS